MAYTTPRTWVAGEYPTAAQFNANIRDNVSFLANPPACRIYHSGAQSIANNTETTVAFDSERFDSTSMHSTVTNNSRITFNTAGIYVVTAVLAWASNNAGNRFASIRKNGSPPIGVDMRGSVQSDLTYVTLSSVYKFAAADYIELRVFQNSGGALNLNSSADLSPEFAAAWIGLG